MRVPVVPHPRQRVLDFGHSDACDVVFCLDQCCFCFLVFLFLTDHIAHVCGLCFISLRKS